MKAKRLLAAGIAGAIALGTVGTAQAADWRFNFSVGRVYHGGHYWYWNGRNYDMAPSGWYWSHYPHHHWRHYRHYHHHWRR